MTSENASKRGRDRPEFTSENTATSTAKRHGRAPAKLAEPHFSVLSDYETALAKAPLSDQTRRTYVSKTRQYLVWIAKTDCDGDPVAAEDARDWAVRDYRNYLQSTLKRKAATINSALAAIDDFYTRRGLGPANAARAELPVTAPQALNEKDAVRFLRAAEACPSPRDRAIALLPFYAGARIAEVTGLDVDDVRLSARKGILRIDGKGDKVREIPVHPQLRSALAVWLQERTMWPGADRPALLLNQRGQRLSAKGAHDIITDIGRTANPDRAVTAHVLRHTFATRLVRGGTDLVLVAELLGHSRLETTRIYTRPTKQDAIDALQLLDTDT